MKIIINKYTFINKINIHKYQFICTNKIKNIITYVMRLIEYII